jgi:hypothetical protein
MIITIGFCIAFQILVINNKQGGKKLTTKVDESQFNSSTEFLV